MSKIKKNCIKYDFPAKSELKVESHIFDSDMANSPMATAMSVADDFNSIGNLTDPMGMWTGNPKIEHERPIQDADDL